MDEMGGECSTHQWEERCIKKTMVGKPEGKRPLGRSKRRWQETGWIHLVLDRDKRQMPFNNTLSYYSAISLSIIFSHFFIK
jgi:hypothetical protein